MWHKFEGPNYSRWHEIDEAIWNCSRTKSSDGSFRRTPGCWNILDCVLNAANANQQAQFSSAATILGLLPTVLSMISISPDDLLQIHCRLPVLAFLLSLCNPSTLSRTLFSDPTISRPLQKERSPGLRKLLSHGLWMPFNIQIPIALWFHDLVLHFLAAACVAVILWQTLVLGVRGVVVFACWTWHNPFTWVSAGGVLHLFNVITWRLCLGPVRRPIEKYWTRWPASISRSGSNLRVVHLRAARFYALLWQVAGLMNYGFGTAILSGMMLINPYIALRTFILIGLSGMVAKLIALWLLSVYPDIETRGKEEAEKQMLPNNSENASAIPVAEA